MKKAKKEKVVINPREEVEKTIEQTELFVARAEKKRVELLAKAKTAKARGDKLSYNMAVSALRTVMQQQKRAEQMVLSLGIAMDLRDVSDLTSSFMTSMEFACKEMANLPSLKKMDKVAGEFNKSMAKVNNQARTMDEYMMLMSESMNGDYDDVELSDDIGKMIEQELASELDSEDIEIQRQLEEAKKRV